MDWVKVYYRGQEVVRWKMKLSEWFQTHLEIADDCPIQDPAFFVCLFQCIFYVGH
ncbi:tubby C-terminal domain-like protein [Paenibacillus sp. 481]|uniref:tubby C-terminal domain-like protein n=1 Tax=Paenibacillus sp. 481 TaxID=2835869 RepID=UPI003FA7A3FC